MRLQGLHGSGRQGVGIVLSIVLLVPLAGKLRSTASAASPEKAERVDAAFTLTVVTPHVAWGKPLPGPPVRAFVVPTVSEGRTLVELAQRIDLQFHTVMIDEAWDVNTWTVGTDQNYEACNYKLLYGYLEEDLTKPVPYDVIILPSLHGWNRLPQAVRQAIRERVRAGAGLVIIHPTTGLPAPDDPKVEGPLNDFAPSREVEPGEELWELSPLVGVLSDRISERGFREVRPDAIASGPWKHATEHFVTANVPFESFPADFLKHYRYRLGSDATPLAVGPEGEPIIAAKTFGAGRVIALGYVNTGLSPRIDWEILGVHNDRWWEYFYSLLCRSILWAAKREPMLQLGKMDIVEENGHRTLLLSIHNAGRELMAEVMAQLLDEWGENEGSVGRSLILKSGNNAATIELPETLAAGRHHVDLILSVEGRHHDWGSICFDLPKADEIISIVTDRMFYERGETIKVRVATRSGSHDMVQAELLDNRDRLLARQLTNARASDASVIQATLRVGHYTTNIGWVRVTLLKTEGSERHKIDSQQVRVNFRSLDRDFGAYEFIMPWYGPPSYQPWTSALDEQFRKVGVTVVDDPQRNFKLVSQIHTPGFGVYWHYRKPYLAQKRKFLETGDKRYLVREPDLADPAWLEKLAAIVREEMQKDKSYRPLAYYLADESSLTSYGDPFDFSWSVPTLQKFRAWLKREYTSLAALNTEWESDYRRWEEVVPLTTAEAQAKGNYAGWMDHRTFMEELFANALQLAVDVVHQEDAAGRASISGTQAPGPSNAVNWYRLDRIIDYLQPYSHDDQDELHRSVRPELILTGFTGYERHGKALRHELWHRLLHGQIGASLFWHYTALNADLTLTEQGEDIAQTIREFRDEGLALLLHGAQRDNCGVAVHYSLLSVRGQWITDGRIHPSEVSNGDETSAHLKRFHENRTAWLQALEDAGFQYDFVTTEQIEQGNLANYRALILPDSIALSGGEVAAIRRFVENGGLVIADVETGLMNSHARWQAAGRIDDVLGVQRLETRSAPDNAPAVQLRLPLRSGTISLEVLPASKGLRTTTGRPEAAAGDTFFVVHNRFGAGHAITLNFWMKDYLRLRTSSAQQPRLAMLREFLSAAGVRPIADVHKASGAPLSCSELIAFQKGDARDLAILPEPGCADASTVTVTVPLPQYVYDLRAHRLLGRVSQVEGTLVPGEPLLYALMPNPVGGLRVTMLARNDGDARVRAGDTVRFAIHLEGRPGESVPPIAAHVEVRNPAGKIIDYYGGTVFLANGEAVFAVPLALNDPPGTWQLTAREPYTHQTAAATFEVVEPSGVDNGFL